MHIHEDIKGDALREDIAVCDEECVHGDIVSKIRSTMPDEDTVFELAELYKVFGDHTRIRILCVLWEGEVCVCDIAELLGMTQSAISHQLRVLRGAKLIKSRRQGKTVYYSLSDDHVITIINSALDHVRE